MQAVALTAMALHAQQQHSAAHNIVCVGIRAKRVPNEEESIIRCMQTICMPVKSTGRVQGLAVAAAVVYLLQFVRTHADCCGAGALCPAHRLQ